MEKLVGKNNIFNLFDLKCHICNSPLYVIETKTIKDDVYTRYSCKNVDFKFYLKNKEVIFYYIWINNIELIGDSAKSNDEKIIQTPWGIDSLSKTILIENDKLSFYAQSRGLNEQFSTPFISIELNENILINLESLTLKYFEKSILYNLLN